jgi:uncharacterized RDD family membrane protein YckC
MDIETKLHIEGFRVASFKKRVLAYTIDEFLVSLILFVAFFDRMMATNGDLVAQIKVVNSIIIYFIVLKTIYHTFFIHFYGKTIGKLVLKIRAIDVVTMDNPSLARSFLRVLFKNIDEMFFYFGMLFALTNPLIQTLHDKISKVVVIDE